MSMENCKKQKIDELIQVLTDGDTSNQQSLLEQTSKKQGSKCHKVMKRIINNYRIHHL